HPQLQKKTGIISSEHRKFVKYRVQLIEIQYTTKSNRLSGETVTELLTVRSDKELEQMIAYSRAQMEVSHNLVFYLHIATCWKGPQAVEKPNQNLTNGAAAVGCPLKLVIYRANSMSVFNPLVVLTQLSWIPNVLAGMVIVQLTQHVYTQQHVAAPLAPRGARVYLLPPENNVLTVKVRITSLRAEYEDTQSECDAFDNLARQSCAPKLILINEITFINQQMGFWSGLKNFGSKILHGVTSAAKWVAPVLHKVMGAVAPTIGAINPTAGMIARGVGGAAGMANKFLNR
ncbi:MAG: hypothetical protein EZS28_045845, partial [Streblomastix strix]